MRLHTTGTSLLIGRYAEPIDPNRAQQILLTRGHSPAVAEALAHGALSTPQGVRALARQAGLIAVETDAARAAGLLT